MGAGFSVAFFAYPPVNYTQHVSLLPLYCHWLSDIGTNTVDLK